MRYRSDHKGDSRRRILTAAARSIREHGSQGVSVAAVMAEAGLTHGGFFFAHFSSKSALITAAIEAMFAESATRLAHRLEAQEPKAALTAHIDYYLSPRHCEPRDAGCPITALGSEAPRLDAAAQAVFA